ncbi:MAG: AAA family ATPase, partial [Candidatus Gracilibacteria bacterium]|nr:AAA family ATPase [Candidatus Gracilibacteria bacterium]
MKIKKITIENFRSIGIEEIIFPESGILSLVGPNNAGKSNIMKAVYNILGDNWFNGERAEINDYFMKDSSNTIKIGIYFDDGKKVLFDSKEGWASYFDVQRPNEQLKKINQWNIPTGSTGSVKDDFPCTLLPANRSLEKNLQFRSYELMGKIAKKFNEKAKERKVELETKFGEVMDILNAVDGFSGFKSDFIDFFNEMQSDSPYKLKVDFKAFSPLNYFKTINILANDSSVDEEFNIDIEELGEGNKSLILFSLLRSYAKNMKQEATGILAIEEPEIYLHPQARRHLYSIFQEIVRESNIQIIYTTHSPDFISTEEFDSLGLVSKDPEEGTQLKIVTKKELVDFSINTGVPASKT